MLTQSNSPLLHALSREVLIHANVQEPVAAGGGGSAKIIREAALQGTVPQAVHEELPMETLIQNNRLANYSGNEHSHELTAQMGSITSSSFPMCW